MSERDETFAPGDHVRVCDCPRPQPAGRMRCAECRCRMADRPVITYAEYQAREESARPPGEQTAEHATAVAGGAPAGGATSIVCPSCQEELPAWETLCTACGALVPGAESAAEAGGSGADASAETYAPGVEVRGYRLEEQIAPGLSGEARLWLAQSPEWARVVVKAYDSEDRKRRDALARLRGIDDPAVVRVLDAFVANGVDHEVQEYLPHGTLRDWMEARPGPVPHNIVRRVLEEASRSLAVIHGEQLIHRDIKPSNFLVRKQAPLTLALADFGLSRRGHAGPHISQTIGRITHHYAAPEAFRQVADPKSDWWSVGIIVYELLAGEHPLVNIDASMVNAFHGYHWIEIGEDVPADWRPLLEGLLTPPVQDRWGGDEVRRWLDGDRHVRVLRRRPTLGDGYDFRGQKAHDPAALAQLLPTDWLRAEAHLSEGLITRWCEEEVRVEDLTLSMRQLVADERIPDDHWRLAVARVVLHPDQPLAFPAPLLSDEEAGQTAEPVSADALRDPVLYEVDAAWCRQFYREAIRIGHSSIPEWLAAHGQPALQEWWRPRETLLRRLHDAGLDTRDSRLQRLVSREREEVVALGEELRERYVESSDPDLQALLETPALDPYGAIRLLMAPGGSFLTAAEVIHRDRLAEMTQSGVDFDREEAAELLQHDEESILSAARSRQREIVRTYDDELDRIRRQRQLSVTEAALLVTAAPHLYLTRSQRRSHRWARAKTAVPHLIGLGVFLGFVWLLQEWSFLRHRGPWLGLVAPVVLAVIASSALLGVLGGVWEWLARDAAAWRRREARARGRSEGARGQSWPQASVYVVAVGVLVAGWFFWDDVRRIQYEWDLEAGAEAVASGRAATVIPSLELLVDRYPQRIEPQLELADGLLWTRQVDRADDVLAGIARLDPYRARLHSLMGWLYRRREWTAPAELAYQRAGYLAPEQDSRDAPTDVSLAAVVADLVPVADALWLAQDSALVEAGVIFDSNDDVDPAPAQAYRWAAFRDARIEPRASALAAMLPAVPTADRLSAEARAIRSMRQFMTAWPLFRTTVRCSLGEPECGAQQHAAIRLIGATRGGRLPHGAYLAVRNELRDAAREAGIGWPYAESLTNRYDGRFAGRYLPRGSSARPSTPTSEERLALAEPRRQRPSSAATAEAQRQTVSAAGSEALAAIDTVESILGRLPALRDAGRYVAAIQAIDNGIRRLRAVTAPNGEVTEHIDVLTDLRAEVMTACRAEAAVFPGRVTCPR